MTECSVCNKDLSTYHDIHTCFNNNGDETNIRGICDKCAWIDVNYGIEGYNHSLEWVIMRYFLSKNNGKNLCMKCDRKYDSDIEDTIGKLNILMLSLKWNKKKIEEMRLTLLNKYINCNKNEKWRCYKDLDAIIGGYAYEE